ncbi:MAG: helicase C-terminal domain-containing protein [bacterium]
MTPINNRFTQEARNALKKHVEEAGGNEVFLVGQVNADKRVESVEVFARGNQEAAPALLQVARQGEVVIHNHPSGRLRPSHADTQVASYFGNEGVGFYIVDNRVSDVFVVVEPFAERRIVAVNSGALSKLMGPQGPIARKLENYEFRPAQIEMIEAVSQAINENKVAIIEAGTGTGKTLAYLLPAISYAVKNKERCVVSTNTINLQEQLIKKDLPFLRAILNEKFKAVLVKGRTNYACKRKLSEAENELDLFSDEAEKAELQSIVAWAESSGDGSKSDLNFVPTKEVWEKIQSESDTSLKTKCPFYNECFFYTARRAAASANILVANHHLLFADLAVRAAHGASENAVLPKYDRIVFDEAHNIEDVATNYFGVSVTYLGLLRLLNRIYHRKGSEEKGLLPFLSGKLTFYAHALPHARLLKAQEFIQEISIASLEDLKLLLTETMEQIFFIVQRMCETKFYETKLRLTASLIQSQEWQAKILVPTKKLTHDMRQFTASLNDLGRGLESFESHLDETAEALTIDLRAQQERLDAAANTIEQVLLEHDGDNIRWIEVKTGYKGSKIVRLHASPLDIGPIMKETVFKKFKNVILTSATLTVANRFDYIENRIGMNFLDSERILERSLPAPFDYEKQALVVIPNDVPLPNDQEFLRSLPELILRCVKISRGRTFVLFTSHGLLNLVYHQMKGEIEQAGYNAYKQGQENRHRLLVRFKDDTSSVLFATDSFWEGVDVHGEALESVIITKLPFKVPSEPVVEARVEAIERRGGNAFMEYTVPQAAIKFRQGFGRLIRRKSDRGSVVILDKRVIQKRYGRIFLNSLPKCRIVAGSTDEVFAEMASFFS